MVKKKCTVDDCKTLVLARGYCSRHYDQLRKIGRILTEEEIHERRSNAHKGNTNCLGKTWKIRDTSNMMGRVPKTAFKKGYTPWSKGLKGWMTPEHMEAIKKANTKYTELERCTNKQLRSKFKQVRLVVLERDGYMCTVCSESSDHLQVDHIKSWADYPELRFDQDNCRTLCMPCHYYVTYKKKLPSGIFWGHINKGGIA